MIATQKPWWDSGVQASLQLSGTRKSAWIAMLVKAPLPSRAELAYLLRYMPEHDLKSLSPQKVEENVRLALRSQVAVAWSSQIPKSIFREGVLPYACVTEPRESMRAEFMAKYLPAVKALPTPGEAALYLNKTLFVDTKVVYNTKRRTTDQAPADSISQGMATCTGLSIMLVDACRAVGVPARIAGINSWPGKGGNHTWVEVWDQGWHFLGAAEPDPQGLDHGWFTDDAAKAIKSNPENSIFAVTYKPTGHYFPLEWAPSVKMNGENVTDRYVHHSAAVLPRIMVEVRTSDQRVEAKVVAHNALTGEQVLIGTTCGPHADTNNYLTKPVAVGTELLIEAAYGTKTLTRRVTVSEDTIVRMDLDEGELHRIDGLLSDRFGPEPSKAQVAVKALAKTEFTPEVGKQAWKGYVASSMHDGLRQEFENNLVKTADRTSPYRWRKVGLKPEAGWGLVIAMHGGGGVPKAENDSQWDGMFQYYRDHPEAGGYIYLALRAPNDEWNGFYDDAISPLIQRLIKQFALFAEVDTRHVYTLGASHGGYGAFVIGTKIPYRFAAVHASAAGPTPGETMGENLRNVQFTWMVGENDKDYHRADLGQSFAKQVDGWKAQYGGFPGGFEFMKHTGHFVPDHDKVKEMRAFTRDSFPKHLVWTLSDNVLQDFYWLHVSKPTSGAHVEAKVEGNVITLSGNGVSSFGLRLDSRLVDLTKPITIQVGGRKIHLAPRHPSLETYCQGLGSLADPDLATPVFVENLDWNH